MAKTITNATAVYTIMLLVFTAGMWAILLYGSTLRSRPDLAGEWMLAPESDPRAEWLRAAVEQSGKFVRIRFDSQSLDLRVVDEAALERHAVNEARVQMRSEDGNTLVTFDRTPAPDVFRLTIDTSPLQRRRFTARLVARTYPRETSAKQQRHNQELEHRLRQQLTTQPTTTTSLRSPQ